MRPFRSPLAALATVLLVATVLALAGTGVAFGAPSRERVVMPAAAPVVAPVAGPVIGPVLGPRLGSGVGQWPLRPRPGVVRRFEPPTSRWGAGHRGVDLLGRPGEAVRSALAGRVTFAGRLAGRGVVVVDHGGRRTTYEPVTAAVSVGDEVAAGEVLGHLEVAGSHCFPRTCLHWGLISFGPGGSLATSDGSGGHYLDPLTLVGAGPVRLLPLTGPLLPLPLVETSLVAP